MSKYIIEGNINFQEELYKLLDEDSENEDELCQITGLHLKDKHVTLECKHHFNYDALYNEICKQKFEFKTYDPNTLTKKDLQKCRDSKLDYFIKCPYCRNIQFTILPYYEELELKKIYGINSLDKTLPNTVIMHNPSNNYTYPYQQGQQIPLYVPEEELGCNAILKSGPNKGNKCGCKKIEANGLCKRHSPKDDKNDELKVEKNVL